jgi:hypothetical protein
MQNNLIFYNPGEKWNQPPIIANRGEKCHPPIISNLGEKWNQPPITSNPGEKWNQVDSTFHQD